MTAMAGAAMMIAAVTLLVLVVRVERRTESHGPRGVLTAGLALVCLTVSAVLFLVGAALAVVDGLLMLSGPIDL